ncbi:hypothetical protein CMI37_13035 [Candidatus Pacearchaeota archaeon]|nr:hypothetical protein [Candidatus Pacearchaeota archaeon]
MANQNVGTPRFYISVLQWLKSLGKIDIGNVVGTDFEIGANRNEALSLLDLNPTNTKVGADFPDGSVEVVNFLTESPIASYTYKDNGFAILLNHNFKSADAKFLVREEGGYIFGNNSYGMSVNCSTDPDSDHMRTADFDGWSLWTADDISDLYNVNNVALHMDDAGTTSGVYDSTRLKLGCFGLGNYYDMPHSPELSLTLSHEYKGITKQTTMGGSTLTNVNYYKPPKWGDLEAWQLGGFPRKYSGRRVWNLSFNYLNDEDLEPTSYHIDESHPTDWKENWFSNVLHYTMGGALPFIFQPNKDATYNYIDPGNGDEYIDKIPELAICRFDMDTFSREQVANGVYNIKVKIKESW